MRDIANEDLLELTEPYPMVEATSTVQEVAVAMAEYGRGAAIISVYGCIVGLITERDIIKRVVAEGRDPRKTLVFDVMSAGLAHLDRDASCADAMEAMNARRCRHVVIAPLVDDPTPGLRSVIEREILLSSCLARDEELLDLQLSPRPERGGPGLPRSLTIGATKAEERKRDHPRWSVRRAMAGGEGGKV